MGTNVNKTFSQLLRQNYMSLPNTRAVQSFSTRKVPTAKDQCESRVLEQNEAEETLICCMSGCPNCVWIEHADTLLTKYKDGGEKAREMIIKEVSDPNMKAYLLFELSIRIKQADL